MKNNLTKLSLSLCLAAACALPAAAVHAQDKRALATKLVQLQLKADQHVMVDQLTASAVQPLIAKWSQRIDETVPEAKQKEVGEKLDAELKKFVDSAQKTIGEQTTKTAESALVPLFMEKLSEDEMKTVIAYFESSASAKFQALSPEAANAWAQKVIDATRKSVEASAGTFDSAAQRIVSAAAGNGNAKAAAAKK